MGHYNHYDGQEEASLLRSEGKALEMDEESCQKPAVAKLRQPTPSLLIVVGGLVLTFIAISSISSMKKLPGKKESPSLENKSTSTSTLPNILFILADDVGWNSLGTDYDLKFTTPYINSLISQGITIENYYTLEVCTPSRASLMTGRYAASIGMQTGYVSAVSTQVLPIGETLFPEVLKSLGGYENYVIGKWNLGHMTPQYLPTSRGFDHFIGYFDGVNHYWSKRDGTYTNYTDLTYSTTSCYDLYAESDYTTYSTEFYTDKALDVINSHDFTSAPMYLYVAYQAAHEPFYDIDEEYSNGIPASYVGTSRYEEVSTSVVGDERKQVAMTLMLLDDNVERMIDALTAVGQLDNTYVVITSDNGGCYNAGGKNGPLRGSKGTLYEGGTKVNAYLYSSLLPSSTAGTTYNGLFHITDWFPTLLGFVGLTYTPSDDGQSLDGIDQSTALVSSTSSTVAFPRSSLLYNIYTNVSGEDWTVAYSAPLALRDNRYKLLHAYVGNAQSETINPSDLVENDDVLADASTCRTDDAMNGTYTKFLFDLVNDPYETTNLYDDAAYSDVKEALYALLAEITVVTQPSASTCSDVSDDLTICTNVWDSQKMFVQPWNFTQVVGGSSTYPSYCTPSTSVFQNSKR